MKLGRKLAALLALLLAAMAFAATAALAATTYSTLTTTTATEAANTTVSAVATITPAGGYTARLTGTLNPTTSSLTIDCTRVTVTGTFDEDGTGNGTVAYESCSESLFGSTCTITGNNITTKAEPTAGNTKAATTTTYVVTNTVSSDVTCFGVDCKVTVTSTTAPTNAGGQITDGDEPAITLTGTVKTDGTSLCTGALSGSGIIHDTAAIDTSGTKTATALGLTTTGNELDIRK